MLEFISFKHPLTVAILFICSSLWGQQNDSIIIFHGRKAPYMQQKVLDLSYRNLKDLPADISNPEIEVLILDNNKIEKLPNRIGNLKNLRILSLRNNNLIELNTALSFCSGLEQLYLSGNINLQSLPNLSNCEKLEIIDVTNTGINEVPAWVEMMDSLYYFKYSGEQVRKQN